MKSSIAAPGNFAPRLEDERFLTGQGRYVDDIIEPGALFMAVVRSEHAHADIRGIDADEALALDGVLAVYTEADLAAEGIGPMPCAAPLDDLVVVPRHALARGVVRHLGEPVAVVIATSRVVAEEAATLVGVDCEERPAVVGKLAALADGAPVIWEQAPGNVAFTFARGDAGAVTAAAAVAAHVVEATLENSRVSAAPMENRAGCALFDEQTGRWHLRCNGQGVHGIKAHLATTMGVSPDLLHVHGDDVGGGFGLKNFLYPEWVVLCFAARRLGAPVHWAADRSEDLSAAAHGRDMHATARLMLDAKGRFLALEARVVVDMGAYLSGSGPNISTRSFPTAMGGIYRIPSLAMEATGVFTNTGTVDAYRGAGKPEANYLVERMIDIAARRCGFDPVALRRLNAVDTFPYQTGFGTVIDCGRFGANIDDAVRIAERDGFEARRQAARAEGLLLGQGVACFLETARGAVNEASEVLFDEDGGVEIRLGTESQGQGHETAFTQLAAHRLGVDAATVRYVQADTDLTRMGNGHGGARSMHMGGHTLASAIDEAIEKGRRVAARLLQSDEAAVSFAVGRFFIDAGQSLSLAEVVRAARDNAASFGLADEGLDTCYQRDNAPLTLPNGCHVAEVAVDPETGTVRIRRYVAVDDYGTLINPPLAEAQVLGGVMQGIGQALAEEVAYDAESGQLLSGSFMDYTIPRADWLVSPDIHLAQDAPTEANVLGVKGTGQAGAIAATQTIVNAVMDALSDLGVESLDMPLTSERVWRAINDAA